MGTKVNDYGVGDVNLTSLMDTVDRQRKGYHAITLSEYDTDNEPAIEAGSIVEVGGALYKFDTEEGIGDASSDDPIDGAIYVRLVPNGDSITADFTNTVPTWDDSKQGWYGTGGEAAYRYIHFGMTLDTGDYTDKYEFIFKNNKIVKFRANGDVDFSNLAGDEDRRIYFASDANIRWNEASDQFEFFDKVFIQGTGSFESRRGRIAARSKFDSSDPEDDVYDFFATYATDGESVITSGNWVGGGTIYSVFLDVTGGDATIYYGFGVTKVFRNGNATAIGADMSICV